MTKLNQNATIFAGNELALEFTITDSAGAAQNMTGKLFTWSMISGTKFATPTLDFNSTDDPTKIVVTDAVNGKVEVRLTNVDTATLANKVATTFLHQLEIFDVGFTVPVMASQGTLTIEPNIVNVFP